MKIWSIIKTILSGIVWGLGQLFNKQYWKSLFFFAFFALFVILELATSNYFYVPKTEDEVALSKITGESLGQWYEKTFFQLYDDQVSKGNSDLNFELFLDEIGVTRGSNGKYYGGPTGISNPSASLFTEERFIEYFAKTLQETSYLRYTNLSNQSEVLPENFELSSANLLTIRRNLFKDNNTNKFYLERTVTGTDGIPKKEYVETNAFSTITNPEILTDGTNLTKFNITADVYKANNEFYVQVLDDSNIKYLKLTAQSIIIIEPSQTFVPVKQTAVTGPLYELNNTIYEYYEPGLLNNGIRQQYKQTKFSEYFRRAVVQGSIFNELRPQDFKKLMIRIYLELNPVIKENFLTSFDNFFYDKAGMFVKGYWEVLTLGVTNEVAFNEHLALVDSMIGRVNEPAVSNLRGIIAYEGQVDVRGHVSTLLLLEGLIAIILSLFFAIFGIWSMIDAYRVSERKRLDQQLLTTKQYFKSVWDNGFEYIILSPALFVLAFISIMPIVFGFVLAFTSISGNGSMDDLFNWVGFSNFINVFDPNSAIGSGFGIAFWRVLAWTIVWAIASTFTVFFGGFIQALILNAESVVFRKLWRTILILPWAIPALLSQMVFSVIFNENGFINQLFQDVGLYTLFKDWGILGVAYQEVSGWAQVFWLGHQNIQWFTNVHNPNFVRLTLIVVNIWLGFPYFMALMTGIMTAIDKSLYEAADIDGASGFQKLIQITMPLVLYSTAPILIMTFSGNFNNFGVIHFITGGGPGDLTDPLKGFAGETDILISWMYRLTTDHQIYNMASVFSVLIFLFVGSVTAWNLSRTKAFQED